MNLLKNKTFAIIVSIAGIVLFGFTLATQVFGVSVRSNMDMYYGKIIYLGTPTYSNDAATKNYVDTAISGFSQLWADNGSYIYPKNASGIYITDDNKIGIGAQPGSYDTLKVNGVGRFTGSLSVGAQSYGSNGDVIASGVGQFGTLQSTGILSASGNSYLGGSVGIGTAPSSYRLDVSGTINASNALCINGTCKNSWDSSPWTSSGSNIYNNNSGYVGIGNSYPSYKLDVSGDTRLNGNVGVGTTPSSSYRLSVYGNTLIDSGKLEVNGYARNNDDYNESGDIIADDGIRVGGRLRVGDNATINRNLYLPGGDIQIYGSIYDWYGYAIDFQDNIDMHSNKIKGVATPSYSDEAANKGYVDSALSGVNLWVDNGSYIRPKDSYYISLYDNGNIEASNLSISNTLFGRWITSDSLQSSYDTTVGRNLYANGNAKFDSYVGIGTSPSYSYRLDVSGNTNIQGTLYAYTKNFMIDHPLDPENKKLVHSSLEGPEVGVYYRGESQLENGKAEVVLPNYFEALTRKENRTVLLTPKFDSFDEPVSQLAASAVENGKFKVKATDSQNPNQKFYWEVKAVRADIAPLEVERLKTENERKAESEK